MSNDHDNMKNLMTLLEGRSIEDERTTVTETGANNPTCSVYCHANWTGNGGQTTVDWTGGAAITNDCNDCHGGSSATPPTRGSHQLHAGSGV